MSNEPTFTGALRQMLGLNTASMISSAVLIRLLVEKGILTPQEVIQALDETEAGLKKTLNDDPDVEAGLRTYMSGIKPVAKE